MAQSQKLIQSVMAFMLQGHSLPIDMFKDLMIYFTSGNANTVEIAGFLKAFSQSPLTSDYLIAAIEVLQKQMIPVCLPNNLSDAIDCCGTGGDGLNSLNISTAVAFILADYGIKVAKHGNRSVTSQSGSADILEYLGYPIQQNPNDIINQLEKTNLSFMFAPYFHPVLKHVTEARKVLGFKTLFNLLGPLLNPALVKRQVIGIYDFKLVPIIAETMIHFGTKRAVIVTSSENSDELTLSGDNQICYIDKGAYWFDILNAKNIGLGNQPISQIIGGNIAFNATAFETILMRQKSAYYDTVILNAAAGLWVAEKAISVSDGVAQLQTMNMPIDFKKYRDNLF